MSNPVKNAGIEDVLSSIRRLVSENHGGALARDIEEKQASAPVQDSSEPKASRPMSDRLVLSPALRIEKPQVVESLADEEPTEPQAEVTSPVADTPFVHSLKEDLMPLRENLPSFLQKRAMQNDMAEGEDDAQSEPEVDAADDFASEAAVDEAPVIRVGVADTHLSEVKNTVPFPAPEDLTFETARKEAADEAHQSPPENGEELKQAEPRPWEIEGERLSEWHSTRTAGAEEGEAQSFEPDGPEDGDNAGTPVAALNWEDHEVEADEPSDVTPSRPLTEPLDPVAEQITEKVVEEIEAPEETIEAQQYEAVLDEEMLRELVGEIVRQELQGPLGERITRNVRKLVRREINRALTARSFNDG